jgi:hypothetical protein
MDHFSNYSAFPKNRKNRNLNERELNQWPLKTIGPKTSNCPCPACAKFQNAAKAWASFSRPHLGQNGPNLLWVVHHESTVKRCSQEIKTRQPILGNHSPHFISFSPESLSPPVAERASAQVDRSPPRAYSPAGDVHPRVSAPWWSGFVVLPLAVAHVHNPRVVVGDRWCGGVTFQDSDGVGFSDGRAQGESRGAASLF